MKTRPPKHLRPTTRRWWRDVAEEFELEPHHLRLLTLAAEAWDRGLQARETIEQEGAYFTDRFKCPRVHPAVGVERDSRIGFARLLRELDLDIEPPRAPARPPGLGR